MSSDGFRSLYYTDCRPGQGLRGGAGFQFQSVSPGVGHDAMTLVQRSALYEAPVTWMREHRAVDAYPASLTHVFDGMYVTARGVYLGSEVNGAREGNQFTHAVATVDPEAYGLIRPAQLWDAPWWSVQPAAGTECDPVPTPPEQGPWGIDAIREWVLGQPDAEEWLVAVSSAFDQAQGLARRRVLFVGADAPSILGWIAAGTLLLPQSRALRLGFRVFAPNPQYSQHDVLGLHPDWAGSFANVDRDGEFVVFNLDSGRHSAVEPTDAAAHWAAMFLRADPFDVVDAVELAHDFARQRRPGGDGATTVAEAWSTAADRQVAAVVALNEPVTDGQQAGGLAGWLAAAPPISAEDIVEPVATAVLAATADASTLRELDGAVRAHGLRGELAGQIRTALLRAEVAEIETGHRTAVDPTTLPGHRFTAAERPAAVEVVERAASRIPPDRMDLLLRTSARFAVEPEVPNFLNAAHDFVTWWVDNPAVRLDPSPWPCHAMLIDLLRDELGRRPHSAALRDVIREYWWRILKPVGEPDTALEVSLCAAAMERAPAPVKERVFAAVLTFVQHSESPDTGELAWDALFRYVAPTTTQLIHLLGQVRPETASAAFAGEVLAALEIRCASRVSVAELDALTLLGNCGWKPSEGRLADLGQQNTALRHWLDSVHAPTSDPATTASRLSVLTETVLRARRAEVLEAVLDVVPLAHMPRVIDAGGAALAKFLLTELLALWYDEPGDGGRDDAVALAFIVAGSEGLPKRSVAGFTARLKDWVRSVPTERVRRVEGLLKAFDTQRSQRWLWAVSDALPRSRAMDEDAVPPSDPSITSPKRATAKDTRKVKESLQKKDDKQAKAPGQWFRRIRGGK